MNLVKFRVMVLSPSEQVGFWVRKVERESEYPRLGAGDLHLLPRPCQGLQQPSGFLIVFAQLFSRLILLAFLPVEVFHLKALALTGGLV
jgi:hypothetical protein